MSDVDIFKVLADPTRRAMLERLATAEMTATELREGFAISQPAMSQHLAVLRGAGLISERRAGRYAHYRVEPQGMAPLHDWLARHRAFWPSRIDNLKDLLKEMDQ
ncbi:MAG: metalloregulator ArsR/SmtB family transcription factor [Alphaproteobacteria bacterium]|nr:metalloregulator ArsR/SmtB family transcription factor [Alphaproteobacteria bacterium]MBU1559440.1 metalloregulator ArsR/SmtB family transcription factor [Alphaproteobacteria bacterium]MBU2301492.1 metalloregulator ArsR/SmtB family transcription factor [Alphaproteobacteria bacterium]MBU2369779.1 metalloregulator ArsR/SmtB family transcription factor [Alphaproteobacteria bacterium]